MSDIVKNKDTLNFVMDFVDGDNRTLTVDNPKATITGAQVKSFGNYIKNNSVVLGDKAGAAFSKISSAKVVHATTTYFDLGT